MDDHLGFEYDCYHRKSNVSICFECQPKLANIIREEQNNLRNEIKIPVELLFGSKMTPIKQTMGGGKRNIFLNKNDPFFNVLNKIKDLYFKNNIHLGSINDYEKSLLDFQLQKIDPRKFRDLESYLKTNGLNKKNTVLFLHIKKELNYEKNRRFEHYNNVTSSQSHHMVKQAPTSSNRFDNEHNTIVQKETFRRNSSKDLPAEKTKKNESPSTSQRVPCSLTQAIRNMNAKHSTSDNTIESNEPYLITNLMKLPINTSAVVYSIELNDSHKHSASKRSRSLSSDSGLSSFRGSMRINQELNERNRKKHNKEIENQHSSKEIKREPMTPPHLSRVISNEENKRRNEMIYNSNYSKSSSSFANSRNDSYKHSKLSDKNYVYSNHSRENIYNNHRNERYDDQTPKYQSDRTYETPRKSSFSYESRYLNRNRYDNQVSHTSSHKERNQNRHYRYD